MNGSHIFVGTISCLAAIFVYSCSSPIQPPQHAVIQNKLSSGVEIDDSLGSYSYFWDTPNGKMPFVISNAYSMASDVLLDYSGQYMQIIVNQNTPDSIDYLMQYLIRADTSGNTIKISPDSVIFKDSYKATGVNELRRTKVYRDSTGNYYYAFPTPDGRYILTTSDTINSNTTFVSGAPLR